MREEEGAFRAINGEPPLRVGIEIYMRQVKAILQVDNRIYKMGIGGFSLFIRWALVVLAYKREYFEQEMRNRNVHEASQSDVTS